MAASHGTAIAKAALSASLLRADPTPIPGDEIARLHSLLDKCLTICTPENIKTCKHWLLEHLVQSSHRVTAFGKYLVALSSSLKSQSADGMTPSSRRRRLYILYLLNDTIHHTTFYSSPPVPFGKGVEQFLKDLFGLAQDPTRKKQRARLENLLSIWSTKGYFSEAKISSWKDEIGKSFLESTEPQEAISDSKDIKSKEQQVLLPALHGDPTAPYHDLPATTMLPLMRPNSPTPISTRSVKPIAMKSGPPSKQLSEAVDVFIKSVDKMWYGGDMRVLSDVDELGVDIIKPSDTQDEDFLDDPMGARNKEEGYYGWSRGFAIQMTKRQKGELGKQKDSSRERGRDRSYSRSLSRTRSRSRSRNDSRSRSRSRGGHSRSESGSRSRYQTRSRSRSRSRSRYRSSRRRRRSYSRSYTRSRSRSRSHTRRRLNSSGSSLPYSPKLENTVATKEKHQLPPPPPPQHPPHPPQPIQQPHFEQAMNVPPQFPFNQQFPVAMPMPPEMAQFFQSAMPQPMGATPQPWGMSMQLNKMPAPGTQNSFNQWGNQGQGNMYNNQPPPPPPPGGNHGYGNQQYGRGGYQGRGGWNNRGGGW
ncbi:hypothetical protein EYR41_011401 [Orbilia oligospora]|uniref:CID domain-containing protein n=1 Tax=Orbilia oligospora TaxID=2813651 RepID=A0A8H2DN38_ORBOL|nr:hypothetical protein EYR41_011401 [Orbilia oligospora]